MTRFGFAEVLASEHDILDGIAWSLAAGWPVTPGLTAGRASPRACRGPAGRTIPATAATPVARDAAEVRALAAGAGTLAELAARQSVCRACPRLVEWREQVAAVKRPSSRGERYWGRPIPGWGDERPAVLIVGLAPAAHGGNRTGRIFTGDRSGDVLFASLYRCGLAAQPTVGGGRRRPAADRGEDGRRGPVRAAREQADRDRT